MVMVGSTAPGLISDRGLRPIWIQARVSWVSSGGAPELPPPWPGEPMSAAPQTDLDPPPPGAPPRADWGRRNLRLLTVFGPLLIVTGVGGLLLPPGLSLMSGAAPYDIFHILFGALGLAIVLARSARWAALFN